MAHACARSQVALCAIVLALLTHTIYGQYTGNPLGPQGYVFGSSSALTQPPVLTSSGGALTLTLTVDVMTVNTGIATFKTRGYYYTNTIAAQGTVATLQAAWPGPTLKIKPGDTLSITLVNKLGANPSALSLDCCGLPTSMLTGMTPTPNTTNLHFHGLATNPDVDSIFITVPPGTNYTYNLPIPSYHAPGCHWYHAHVHGSVSLQVMGGLAGTIYVEPTSPSTDLPAELNAMARYLMFMQHISQTSNNTNSDPFTVRTYTALQAMAGDTLSPNFQWTDSSLAYKDVYLTNGKMQSTLTVAQNAWTLFDFVNAVGDHVLEIDVRTAVLGGTKACDMYAMAYDGVYFNAAPRNLDFLAMVPGQRATVAIRCATAGTFYMQTWGSNTEGLHSSIADTEVKFNQLLMTVTVTSSSSSTTSLPTTLANIPRPSYLADLRSTTAIALWEQGVDQSGSGIGRPTGHQNFWVGIGSNCTLACGGRENCDITDARTATCGYETFNGVSRSVAGTYRHVSKIGLINQLTIQGRGKTPHPMHMHTMHVQLQSDLAQGAYGLAGDWRDTVPAMSGPTVVKYPNHFPGMMDTIYIQSNATATYYNSCTYPTTCTIASTTPLPPPPASAPLPPGALMSPPPPGQSTPPPVASPAQSPPASPPPSPFLSVPPPSPAAVTVIMDLTLVGVDFNAVIGNATRVASLKTGVCTAALKHMPFTLSCLVNSLRQGSVVAEVAFSSTDPSASSTIQSTVNQFAANPQSSFSPSFVSEFGVTDFVATVKTQGPSDSKSFPTGAVVGGAVGGAVGLVLAVAVVWMIVKNNKVKSCEGSESGTYATEQVLSRRLSHTMK